MKHILAVSAAILVAVLMAACTAQSTITPTTAPTASATEAVVASSTPAPTATLAPTIEPSPTFVGCIPPTPAPTIEPVETVQDCITIENELPADLELDGALVLSDWMDRLSMYHLDLMSRRRSPFPNNIFGYYARGDFAALSPDGKWMAYFETAYDEKGRQKDRILQVANAEGRHLDMSYWTLNWQNLIGWKDEKHLILAVEDFRGGDYIVLNPFTGEYEVLDIKLRDLLPSFDWFLWHYHLKEAVPDPTLSYWVATVETDEYILWQLLKLEGKETLWEGHYSYWNQPIWSPDGRYFAVMGDFSNPRDREVNWMLLLVDKEGAAVPLSNLIGGDTPKLSWSPNSQFLAGWMQFNPNEEHGYPNQLALINIQKQTFTDLCIQYEAHWNDDYRPIWSPDNRYLAIAISRTAEVVRYGYSYETIVWDTAIIDLQERRGYILDDDAVPLAWMRKP